MRLVFSLAFLFGFFTQQVFALPKHTKESSFKISRVLSCEANADYDAGVCLDGDFQASLPVIYFERFDAELEKVQNDHVKTCSAVTTGKKVDGSDGPNGFLGTSLKKMSCKLSNSEMIAIVGEKRLQIEKMYFGKIEDAKRKENILKLLAKQPWHGSLKKLNPAFADPKRLKILNVTYQKIEYYVITLDGKESSAVIFGTDESLELINSENAHGGLASAFKINGKPIVWIQTCVKETDACQGYIFELTN